MSQPTTGKLTDAIIIAGGSIRDPEFREAVGTDCRALIDLLGKPMVQWVAEALKSSQKIGRVVVLGRSALKDTTVAGVVDQVVEEGADEVDNIFRGLEALPGIQRLLVASGDLPLLTAEALDDFLNNAPPEGEVVFPICEREVVLRDFPNRKWVFVRTPEGRFTGAALFSANPEALRQRREWLERVFESRRSVWKLINLWGLGFALKALTHHLSIAEAEERISEVLGLKGRAYQTPFTELVMDVDKPSDVVLCEERLRSRQDSSAP